MRRANLTTYIAIALSMGLHLWLTACGTAGGDGSDADNPFNSGDVGGSDNGATGDGGDSSQVEDSGTEGDDSAGGEDGTQGNDGTAGEDGTAGDDESDVAVLRVERAALSAVGDTEFTSINPDYGDADADADSDTDSDADGDWDDDFGEHANGVQDVSNVAQVIEDADIVKVKDNVLYAVSQSRGLAAVDISDPADMRLLGRHIIYEVPEEMYIRDGVVVLMYRTIADYRFDLELEEYYPDETFMAIIVDVSNPAEMAVLSRIEIPGTYHTSRLVGDVLYSVGFLYGPFGSEPLEPGIVVSSISLALPGAPVLTDQLSIPENVDDALLVATETKLFISGPVTFGLGDFTITDYSKVYTVDISSGDGEMSRGADIQLAGQVESQFQLDVAGDVLRTVSHDLQKEQPPVVETFRMNDDDSVTRLGALSLSLPNDVVMKSARFDGARLYLLHYAPDVRSEQLWTVDMSDPVAPAETGAVDVSLDVIDTLIPRGDRLFMLGLGRDDTPGVSVSMLNVADLSSPAFIDAVSFGGVWADIEGNWDDVHKAIEIIDEAGLLLVPFAAWSVDENNYRQEYYSGVQLIDFNGEQLSLRGIAPHNGTARKTFVSNNTLYAVSGDRVESFNIENRDEPALLSSVTLGRTVHAAVRAGEYLAALTSNRQIDAFQLSLFPLHDPDAETPVGALSLAAIQPEDTQYFYFWHGYQSSASRLFYNDGFVYLLWDEPAYHVAYDDGQAIPGDQVGLAVVDISEPSAPTLRSHRRFPFRMPNNKRNTNEEAVWTGDNIVCVGSQIYMQSSAKFYELFEDSEMLGIDVSNPDDPMAIDVPERPFENQHGSMIAGVDEIVFTHSEEIPDDPDHLKFYMDLLDVSDPPNPKWRPKISVPGNAVYYSKDTSVLVSVDYTLASWPGDNAEECRANSGWYVRDDKNCVRVETALMLSHVTDNTASIKDVYAIEGPPISQIEVTDTAIFASIPEPWKNENAAFVNQMLAAPLEAHGLNVQINPLAFPMSLLAAGGNSVVFNRGWYAPGVIDLFRIGTAGELFQHELRIHGYPRSLIFSADALVGVMGVRGAHHISLP